MKTTIASIAFASTMVTFNSIAQLSSAVPENVRAANTIDRFGDGIINEMIYGIPLPAPKVVGDTYIDAEWKKGRIFFYNREGHVDGYRVRYDLYKHELEIESTQGVRIVPAEKIRSFATVGLSDDADPQIFVNAKEYRFANGASFVGFLRVVADGSPALLSGVDIIVKRPDYNEAMNVGSRDYRIVKKEHFFYMADGTVNKLPEKKKELVAIFPPHQREEAGRFIADNKIRMSDSGGLQRLFTAFATR